MNDKAFQCGVCLEKNSDARRKAYGCKEYREDANKFPIHHYSQKIIFHTCPGNFYDSSVEGLLFVNEKFNQGIMPFGGTLMQQPAKFIQAMQLIDSVRDRLIKEATPKPKKSPMMGKRRG